MDQPKYKRVVLKVSGEALAGEEGFGIKPPTIKEIAKEIKEVHDLGVEIAIVVGGETFGVDKLVLKWEWNVHKQIIWACLPQ